MTEAKHPLERDVDAFVERVYGEIQALPEAPAPFGHVQLTPDEALQTWLDNRANPEYWAPMLAERDMQEVIDYDRSMRKLMEERNARTQK